MALRPAGRALLTLALAVVAAFPAAAPADIGPGGFGIADDLHRPSAAMDDTFDDLAPSTFRLNATWTALSEPSYLAQIQSRIAEANAAARGPGGMEIAVSFTVPPQTWQGVALTGEAWLEQVKPFIDRFSSEVEWWGPMNEPNRGGWTFTPTGAAALADFSVRLKGYLEQAHPTDGLMSPDFMDHYNSTDDALRRHPAGDSFVERYVKKFAAAGGEFGSAVAWHPYGAVKRKSMLSTDDLVFTLSGSSAAELPIWVTEAGAHVDDDYVTGQTEAEQDAQVRWMTDTTSGLASHDRITRIHYYNMREEPDFNSATCQALAGFPWDTALVRACGSKRPAWYTWCLASRQGDGGCYDDSPSAASWAPSRLDVFWRGSGDDNGIYRRSWEGKSWSGSSSFGGNTNSSTALAAPADKRLDALIRGTDDSVYARRYNGSAWSGWTNLGLRSYSSPAAAARRGTTILDAFARGSDNAIHHRWRDGIGWSPGWVSIGAPPGGATSAPAAVSSATGRIDVFVRGADAAIWRNTWAGSWSGWTSVGGVATSAPAAATRGTGRLDVLVRGADGAIHHSSNDGAGWSSWASLGGATISAPAAVAPAADRLDVWSRAADSGVQHKVWKSTTGWSGWSKTWFAGPKR